jgi:hypothetical protein
MRWKVTYFKIDQKDLNSMYQINSTYIDKSKLEEAKHRLNKRIDDLEHNAWWYKYAEIDTFEVDSLISEIDMRYNFTHREDILNKQFKK